MARSVSRPRIENVVHVTSRRAGKRNIHTHVYLIVLYALCINGSIYSITRCKFSRNQFASCTGVVENYLTFKFYDIEPSMWCTVIYIRSRPWLCTYFELIYDIIIICTALHSFGDVTYHGP
jgi:hypothetical protein